MTNRLDLAATPLLPFDPAQIDRCGIRMTRAEFARFLGVSKQAVGDWVRAGKVTLGPDGRLDPRHAVAQLLRTSDPDKLRSRVLAPLLRDVGRLTRESADLRARLSAAEEEAEFHQGAAAELLAIEGALLQRLRDEWEDLRRLPPAAALAAIDAWMQESGDAAGDPDIAILDCLPIENAEPVITAPAPDAGEAGGGVTV